MAETTTAAPTVAKKTSVKKPKAKPAHPKTSQMVDDAIRALKDKKGSSLAAIKKHIVAHNKVDADKIAPLVKRYVKKAVTDGILVQTKGIGANGSFKIAAPTKEAKPKTVKAKTLKKKTTTKKTAAAAAKKPTTPKKKKAVKKTTTKSKKEKKPAKSPKKPKAPKPKKAAAAASKAKKAAPKKK